MTHDQQKLKHQVILQNKHNTTQYLRGDFNLVKDGNLPKEDGNLPHNNRGQNF